MKEAAKGTLKIKGLLLRTSYFLRAMPPYHRGWPERMRPGDRAIEPCFGRFHGCDNISKCCLGFSLVPLAGDPCPCRLGKANHPYENGHQRKMGRNDVPCSLAYGGLFARGNQSGRRPGPKVCGFCSSRGYQNRWFLGRGGCRCLPPSKGSRVDGRASRGPGSPDFLHLLSHGCALRALAACSS